MGYHDHGQDDVGAAPAPPAREPLAVAQAALGIAVRLLGVGLLLVGLWVGAGVVIEGWRLYREPVRIERFAQAIEHGSNLDHALSSFAAGASAAEPSAGASADAGGPDAPLNAPAPATPPHPRPPATDTLRLSYFAAWFVALLLLVVVGALAMAAVSTGGRLALYDTQAKRLSREMVAEMRRARRAA